MWDLFSLFRTSLSEIPKYTFILFRSWRQSVIILGVKRDIRSFYQERQEHPNTSTLVLLKDTISTNKSGLFVPRAMFVISITLIGSWNNAERNIGQSSFKRHSLNSETTQLSRGFQWSYLLGGIIRIRPISWWRHKCFNPQNDPSGEWPICRLTL